jgi:2'-5' RNA ligase
MGSSPEPGVFGHLAIYSPAAGTLLYRMRLFIGIPLPGPASARVGEVLRDLRDRGWPVRWVRDGGLHLTLKFFGEVAADRLDTIQEALARAAKDTGPIELVLGAGGAFPTIRRARVLRLEVQADSELELLQDRLERACEEIGYPPEGRPFFPHVTLGRVREGERLPREAAAMLDQMRLDFPFLAEKVVLFESQQTRQGPVYSERLVHVFAARARA